MTTLAHLHPHQQKRLQRIRQLSHVLDEAIQIPGTNKRIGLDPIIGLFPGGGDTVSMLLSAYIVVESALLGLPKSTLLRMVLNIAIDGLTGTVPVLGDLFDAVSKANTRNLKLVDAHVNQPQFQAKVDLLFIILLVVVLALMVTAFATVVALLFGMLSRLFS
jgi:Domain of unknown function (DUF4112)